MDPVIKIESKTTVRVKGIKKQTIVFCNGFKKQAIILLPSQEMGI